MSEAILGLGTLLQRWHEGEWKSIAEMVTIDGPAPATGDVDATSHDSPDAVKEFIPELTDMSEVSFEGNFLSGSDEQKRIQTDQLAGNVSDYRIVIPDADEIENRMKWALVGYIKGASYSSPHADKMTISGALKVSEKAALSDIVSDDLTDVEIQDEDEAVIVLDPLFGAGVYAYTGATTDTAVTVHPVGPGVISVNGVEVGSGDASDAIALEVGDNYITVKAVQTDKLPVMYSFVITRT